MNAPDPAVLTDLLREHLDPSATCTAVGRSAVGNSQETWILDVDVDVDGRRSPHQLVLRRTAAAGTLEWSDRATEVAALGAAASAGLPVPRVRWWDADGGALERPYLVMDRAPGTAPNLGDRSVGAALAGELGRVLARLHRRAVVPAGMAVPTSTQAASRAELARWVRRLRATRLAPDMAMALAGWLTAHVPDDGATAVLLWGDPGPHNVLTDDRGTITAVLDWELAMGGHPGVDLGAARWACLGHLDRDALAAAYVAEGGVLPDPPVLAWFDVLACVTRSAMLLDGLRAALDDRASDPNALALATAMVSANLVRGARLAWADDVGDVAVGDDVAPAHLHPTAAERDRVLGRFLASDVLPAIGDRRLRRQVKIAAALLRTGPDDVTDVDASRHAFTAEARGRASKQTRRRWVSAMLAARRDQQPVLDLYGAVTAL